MTKSFIVVVCSLNQISPCLCLDDGPWISPRMLLCSDYQVPQTTFESVLRDQIWIRPGMCSDLEDAFSEIMNSLRSTFYTCFRLGGTHFPAGCWMQIKTRIEISFNSDHLIQLLNLFYFYFIYLFAVNYLPFSDSMFFGFSFSLLLKSPSLSVPPWSLQSADNVI